ncbi:hypothetical protein Poli38472_014631 [Pythium oligandrum]|uniref:Arrestin C-terminal-like domain-containing protein n=1 Tax=Pythium oligandrum TaxID=41045 RepID=A0A8K1CJN1_PYTOL|nr:hypothetical protein Poli38472_014631 [Pythium oligandrum]|eukprot:TMW63926.1 hypothetical protein Poli38472_014631 [Pythium oligandrum]
MGKLAAALGIGVKGSIAITLDRPTYQPGETLVGQITLRAHEDFDGKELLVTINGEEQLSWETTRYDSLNQHHKRRRVLVKAQHVFARSQRYRRGDYVFPFDFTLPNDLPTSFDYWESRVSDMISVHASARYSITASLPVPGTLKSDLSNSLPVRIVAPTGDEPESLDGSDRKDNSFLGLFDNGHCTLAASLATNQLRQKEDGTVRCRIENNSRKRVKHVRTELVQLVELLPGDDKTHIQPQSKTRTVNRTDYFSVDAGGTRSAVLEPAMVDRDRIAVLLPSLESEFVRVSYALVVKCKYSMSEGPSVAFPLTILHSEAPRYPHEVSDHRSSRFSLDSEYNSFGLAERPYASF